MSDLTESDSTRPPVVATARALRRFLFGGGENARFKEALVKRATELPIEDQALYTELVTKIGLLRSDIEAAAAEDGELWAPENELLCLVQSFLIEESEQELRAGTPRTAKETSLLPSGAREAQFDDKDIFRWALSFIQWYRRWPRFRHPFVELPLDAPPIEIPDDTSLALFADWGVGPLYGAVVIKETIEDERRIPDPLYAAIHLGDTYYSGTEKEIQKGLTDNFPARRADVNKLALNGNHEMYSGARGYYAAVKDFFKQTASYFALQNKHFTIIGLDTAYEDHQLAGNQVEWVKRILSQAGASRRVILLSHHQPFSPFEPGGSRLVAQLDSILKSQRILAWYWGHEHRCVVYEPHRQWATLGRCIGHGGYPYFIVKEKVKLRSQTDKHKQDLVMPQVRRDDNSLWYTFPEYHESPGGMILGDDNRYMRDAHARYGAQGFVVLKMRGPEAVEQFLRPDGTLILEQKLAR